jgi:hypothetical protein
MLAANLHNKTPFTFIRFSDGETEILRNRYLEINNGTTIIRGKSKSNRYPVFDAKRFDPIMNRNIREDLLEAATYAETDFYKGIPSSHSLMCEEQHLLVRLNGGIDRYITFADLFLNNNYSLFRSNIVPKFSQFAHLYVVCNHRSDLQGVLNNAVKISVNDNFFSDYNSIKYSILRQLSNIPEGSLVLSSASSLSKIIGHNLKCSRKDLTFLDVGTSINDLLNLPTNIRSYLNRENLSFKDKFKEVINDRQTIKW